MPRRNTPLITGNYYHIFNHSIDDWDICGSNREFQRFLLTMWFYLPIMPQIKLSSYLTLGAEIQQEMIKDINSRSRLISLHAFSIMPNHYHFLIEQLVDDGISKYIGNIQNSFSKYFNIKNDRKGSLFITPFKAKIINTEQQFLHVSRYIHLNRYSSGIVKTIEEVKCDKFSSLPDYLGNKLIDKSIVSTEMLKSLFKSDLDMWNFVSDQADYQRNLEFIKHILDD